MKVTFNDRKMELKAGNLYGVFTDADEKKLIADYPDEIKDLYEGVRSQYDPKPQKAFFTALKTADGAAYIKFYCVSDMNDAETWREAAGKLVREAYSLKLTSAETMLPDDESVRESFVRGLTEGSALAAYMFDEYKTDKKAEFSELSFYGGSDEKLCAIADEACAVCEEVNFTRSLVDEIGDVLTPEVLAEKVAERAKAYGVESEIWDETRIQKEGMGALWGVGKGSKNPPRFVILRYNGDPSSDKRLALVGKGVTYDTGGYCLKPGSGMMDMKDDMGGAAAVFGALFAAAKRKLRVNLVAVSGVCENSIDNGGFKPGDILKSLKGTTIEVINTDAEGRITLSDSVYYAASREHVTHIIDAATLTGSAISTFGSYYTAAVTSDQSFFDEFKKAAEVSGEHFWQLPCDKRYRKLLESKVADIKNLAGREGGCIVAGMFIKDFTEGLPWIHLDLCGAYYDKPVDSYVTDLATGQPVRTLYEMAKLMQA